MSRNNVLLVEGPNDFHVCYSLFKAVGVPETFAVKDKGGYDNIVETLPVELRASDRTSLGVVVDADVDLTARWQSVRSRLIACGYSDIEAYPDEEGTIVSQPDIPLVGIWLMPDNKLPGMLEDFVHHLVPNDDSLMPYAEQCVDGITEQDRCFPDAHRTKALIHTWLAWQQAPGTPMGQAITRRYLAGDSESAQRFLNWIHRLFIAPYSDSNSTSNQ